MSDTALAERLKTETAAPSLSRRVSSLLDQPNVLRVLSIVALLTVWQIAAMNVNPIMLPTPERTVSAFINQLASGRLITALLSSLTVLSLGYGLAALVGIPLGLMIGRYRRLMHFTSLYVNTLYAVPSIAFIPLLMMWLGLDLGPKVTLTFLSAFFPIMMNTQAGVANVDQTLSEVSASFGANEREALLEVVLPSSVPFIVAGLRIAIGRALVGVVVAEFQTTPSGLGSLLTIYGSLFQTANFFAPLILLAAMSLTLSAILQRIEDRVAPWKSVSR
jgi:NitT/TauT family transport system permease protein